MLMECSWTPWTPGALHEHSTKTPWALHGHSMSTPQRLHGLHEHSMSTPWTLHEHPMNTPWTLWVLHEHSMSTPWEGVGECKIQELSLIWASQCGKNLKIYNLLVYCADFILYCSALTLLTVGTISVYSVIQIKQRELQEKSGGRENVLFCIFGWASLSKKWWKII